MGPHNVGHGGVVYLPMSESVGSSPDGSREEGQDLATKDSTAPDEAGSEACGATAFAEDSPPYRIWFRSRTLLMSMDV